MPKHTIALLLPLVLVLGPTAIPAGGQQPDALLRLPELPLEEEAPLDLEAIGTPPPLQSDYPPWLVPLVPLSLWKGSLEFGINGMEGNSQSLNIRLGAGLTRETERTKTTLDAVYFKARSDSILTQEYANFNAFWQRQMDDSPWSVFARTRLEYDVFKAFDLRLTLSGGLGYDFLKTDITKLTGRFGAGVSHEIGGPDESWVPEANIGLDFSRKLSERQQLTWTSDYYPSWEDFADYRLVSSAAWEIQLDTKPDLRFKIGAIDEYDSTPNGRRPNDINYFLALVWQL